MLNPNCEWCLQHKIDMCQFCAIEWEKTFSLNPMFAMPTPEQVKILALANYEQWGDVIFESLSDEEIQDSLNYHQDKGGWEAFKKFWASISETLMERSNW